MSLEPFQPKRSLPFQIAHSHIAVKFSESEISLCFSIHWKAREIFSYFLQLLSL